MSELGWLLIAFLIALVVIAIALIWKNSKY